MFHFLLFALGPHTAGVTLASSGGSLMPIGQPRSEATLVVECAGWQLETWGPMQELDVQGLEF